MAMLRGGRWRGTDSGLMIPATQVPLRAVSIPRGGRHQGPGAAWWLRERQHFRRDLVMVEGGTKAWMRGSLPGQQSLMGLQMPPFLCTPVFPATKYTWDHLYDPYSLSPHPVPQNKYHHSGPNSATYSMPFPSPSCAFVSSH